MPIWSLTQERVEKLLKQIGDKEIEIDTLIKLSKEDIWKRDLDDFINEWRFQLEDEAKRQKKIANTGRRASNKLRIGAAGPTGRKRKAKGEDSDESDFGGPAGAKKAAPVKKAVKKEAPKDSLLGGLQPLAKANQPKEVAKPSKAAAKAASTKVNTKPKAGLKDIWMNVDNDSDGGTVAPIFKKAKTAIPASKPAVSVKAPKSEDDDSADEEIVLPVAGARQRRAAAAKPVAYTLDDSDDSNGDGMLMDLGTMVKGIGTTSQDTASNTRPLFSASASISRPGSSAGIPKKPTASARQPMDLDGEADDTDYAMLAPPPTDKKAVTARETVISDDSMDDDPFVEPAPAKKAAPATKPGKAAPAPKPALPKKAPTAVTKKSSQPAKAPVEPKKLPLSPAAKAYAAKQQKARAQTKKVVLDDSDDDEVEKVVDELLSDDVVDEEDEPIVAAARRPARKAAVAAVGKTRGAYGAGSEDDDDEDMIDGEDESEVDEETAGFEEEGSSF